MAPKRPRKASRTQSQEWCPRGFAPFEGSPHFLHALRSESLGNDLHWRLTAEMMSKEDAPVTARRESLDGRFPATWYLI